MSIEAMKLALEALETAESFDIDAHDGYYLKAITALRQAIEQAQKQEPVGQLCEETYGRGQVMWFNKPADGSYVYTSTPQQKQEPVAWITEKISGPTRGYMTVTFNKDTGWKDARSIPLYEHPPQRQPLTDERCGGCEACIDSACGREDCPKGWKESASVAYIRGLEDGARQNREPLTDEKIINEADRFDWDKDCAVRFARAIEAAHGIKGEA